MDRMSDGFTVFDIIERGKPRTIKSIHINERMVQNAETKEVLLPRIRPKLIYDNYAALEDRGISQALNRLEVMLQREWRRWESNDFWIAVGDLKAYFDSIQHDVVYEQCYNVFWDDPKSLYLTMDFVDAVGEQGFGLGSQIFQTLAVFYPNTIDHKIKEEMHIEGYGRYADDFVLIHESKKYLQQCMQQVEKEYTAIGIKLNTNKTQIIHASKEFKFLKAKIHVTETGKVIMRPDHDNIVRERRKLKALKVKLDAGEITFGEIKQQYDSWRGYLEHFNSKRTLESMDKLFDDLFIKQWRCNEHEYKRREREYYKYTKFGEKQSPAQRRYGLELETEWD